MESAPKLSVVLVSPELEKLHAAALMSSVAAASGMEVNVFATMGALNQFRRETVQKRAFVLTPVGERLLQKNVPLFHDLLAQGKELGDLHVYACAMAADLMEWKKEDLLDIVEDVIGVNAFFNRSEGAQIVTM